MAEGKVAIDLEAAMKALEAEGETTVPTLFFPTRDVAVMFEHVFTKISCNIDYIKVAGTTRGSHNTVRTVLNSGLSIYEFKVKERYAAFYEGKNVKPVRLFKMYRDALKFHMDLVVTDIELTIPKYPGLTFEVHRPKGSENPVAELAQSQAYATGKRGAIFVLDLTSTHNLASVQDIQAYFGKFARIRLCSVSPKKALEATCRLIV